MRDHEHIVAVPKVCIGGNEGEGAIDSPPVLLVGLGIVEQVRLLEEVPGGTQSELLDYGMVGGSTVRTPAAVRPAPMSCPSK